MQDYQAVDTIAEFNEALDLGWKFHHHYETDQSGQVTANQWYAADPDWVQAYHESGGTWAYTDAISRHGGEILGINQLTIRIGPDGKPKAQWT